jgi:hypothetical protein
LDELHLDEQQPQGSAGAQPQFYQVSLFAEDAWVWTSRFVVAFSSLLGRQPAASGRRTARTASAPPASRRTSGTAASWWDYVDDFIRGGVRLQQHRDLG